MEKIFLIATIVAFYISIPGYIQTAGYDFYKGLIPFYNLYLLIKSLEIPPIILIIFSLLIIISNDRMFFYTTIYIFTPFLIGDAYHKNIILPFICLILPFIMYPIMAYTQKEYIYEGE